MADEATQRGVEAGTIGTLSGLGSAQITQQELMGHQCSVFEPPGKDTSMLYKRVFVARPLEPIETGASMFTFSLPGHNGLMVDTSSMRLEGKFRIEKYLPADEVVDSVVVTPKETWSPLTSGDAGKVSIINNYGQSLFKSVTVALNGVNVSFVATHDYPLKCYLEQISAMGVDASNFHMAISGFATDVADAADDKFMEKPDKGSFKERSKWLTEAGGHVAFSSRVSSDVLNSGRLFLDNMPIMIEVELSRSSYLLQVPGREIETAASGSQAAKYKPETVYRLKMAELSLRYRKIQLRESLKLAIDNRLNSGARARYPIQKSSIKWYNVAAGSTHLNWDNAITGNMPFQVIAGFVDQRAQAGDRYMNAFNFKPFNVADFYFSINNVECPTGHYKPNFSSGREYLADYAVFVDELTSGRGNIPNKFTPELWKNGYTLFAYDTSPDGCAGFHKHYDDSGTLSVHARFRSPLENNISVFLYATFHAEFEIDVDRQVFTEVRTH